MKSTYRDIINMKDEVIERKDKKIASLKEEIMELNLILNEVLKSERNLKVKLNRIKQYVSILEVAINNEG